MITIQIEIEDVGNSELKLTFQMSGKANTNELDFGRQVESAMMALIPPGRFIGPQIDVVMPIAKDTQN